LIAGARWNIAYLGIVECLSAARVLGVGIEVTAPPGPVPIEDRLRAIQSITDAALSGLDDREFLAELLDRTREILQADTAVVLLLDFPSGQLIATAAAGLEEEVRQGVRIPVGRGFAGRIAAEHHPVVLDRSITPPC
jgi:signal transduction protein with GAF and PtsI domain